MAHVIIMVRIAILRILVLINVIQLQLVGFHLGWLA